MLSVSSSVPTPQPAPSYILRGHIAQLSILTFALDGRSLYSGDVEGWVAVWNLKTFRPILFWKAHEGGLLSIEPWAAGILTHGRDNKIHYFPLPSTTPSISRTAATAVPSPKDPTPLEPSWSLDVNALAYCKMSLLRLPNDASGEPQALVAVPALTKDDQVDIFHLPSLARVHRSVGADAFAINDKTGTAMAVSLFLSPSPASSLPASLPKPGTLHLLAGYEDGRVALFQLCGTGSAAFDPPTSRRDEGEDWSVLWEEKGHREALMAIQVSPDHETAWSVAADHHLCRYRLFDPEPRMDRFETPAPGRAAIDIRDDGKLVGVAGWDGEARLYSAKSGAPLAVLSYHRSSLHALAFGPLLSEGEGGLEEDSDEEEEEGRAWMATGGKDERISLWEVYPPSREVVKV